MNDTTMKGFGEWDGEKELQFKGKGMEEESFLTQAHLLQPTSPFPATKLCSIFEKSFTK